MMPDRLKAVLSRLFSLKGRINRTEFFVLSLLISIVNVPYLMLVPVMRTENYTIMQALIFWPCTAVLLLLFLSTAARRLHDWDLSSKWILLIAPFFIFAPLRFLWLLGIVISGTDGANRFGIAPFAPMKRYKLWRLKKLEKSFAAGKISVDAFNRAREELLSVKE